MMSRGPVSPDPNQQKHPHRTLAGAYLGFVTFGALNVLAFFVMSNGNERLLDIGAAGLGYRALLGAGLLAVVMALAAWAYVGWGRSGFAVGLVGGYALMTIISGGTCTLFVNRSPIPRFNIITGPLLYIGAVLIVGLVLLLRRLSRSGWM